jgi:small subunit ribosomal protein S16
MLTIRFARVGRKNRAQFRIVLQEHTAAPGGRHVAMLGNYDPHQKKVVLKADKIKEWISKGAQVSDSVYNLLLKMKKVAAKESPAAENETEEAKSQQVPKEETVKEEKKTE